MVSVNEDDGIARKSNVAYLAQLVTDVILASGSTVANANVAVLGDLLVGLGRSLVGELGGLVRDVVGGVLDGIHFGWLWKMCGKSV